MIASRNALCAALLCAAAVPAVVCGAPLGTAFTYQGQLRQSGTLVTGNADFIFSLYDAATGGALVGSPVARNGVAVSHGLFSETLDFGSAAFDGQARWLQVQARYPAGTGAFIVLLPRQPITAAPYAWYSARPWITLGSDVAYTAGDVGIGTTNPQARLHISEPGEGIRIQGQAVGGANAAWITFADASGTHIGYVGDGSSGDNSMYLTSYAGSVVLYTAAGAALTATPTGDVGIRTPSPNAGLHVRKEPVPAGGTLSLEGDTHVYMTFFPRGAASGRKAYMGFAGSFATSLVIANEFTGQLGGFNGGDILLMTGPPFGCVGINVLDPDYALALPNHGDLAIGSAIATSWRTYSSRRWKENIRPIPDALDKVGRLEGVLFDWTATHGGTHDVGFVAEDVAAVLPELVDLDKDEQGAVAMKYDRVTALNVEAIKELHAKVAQKDARIAALEQRVARLETLLDRLTPEARGQPAAPAIGHVAPADAPAE